MEFFLLRNHKKRSIKNNIIDINDKINEINNKIIDLQDKNLFDRIHIKNNKDFHSENYAYLNEKIKVFLIYYEKIEKNIASLEQNINEIS